MSVQPPCSFEDFLKLDIRAGTILEAAPLEGARKPAYRLAVDLGEELGVRQSTAQLTDAYQPPDLIGRQVLAVVNLPPKRVAGVLSGVLVLGLYADAGVILISPQRPVKNGDRLG